MFQYTIHPDSEIPVYRQLADQINAEIRSGALKTGEKLPTVREMAQQMHLSCGTVKRVYDRLAELGDMMAEQSDALAELGDMIATLQGGEQ